MKLTKKTVFKISGIFLGLSLVLSLIVFVGRINAVGQAQFSNNGVEIRNGVQYISLRAGLGYSPNRILATASIPTKLEIETKNTYDCTAYLDIPRLNVKKFLPPTGITEIDVQGMAPGEEIEGYCGSDTYKFIIKFS